MDRDRLLHALRRDEGFRPHAYQDHLGYWTIGIGRLVDKDKGGGLSEDEALYLLSNDVDRVVLALDDRIPWWRGLTDRRREALVNMAFNLGVGGLMGFRNMLGAMERGDFADAAREATDSRWAKQVGDRAYRIAAAIREG